MEKTASIDFLKSFAHSQEKVRSDFKAHLEAGSKAGKPPNANEALKQVYEEALAITPPFHETVEEIMRIQGMTKKRGGREVLDYQKAAKLTKLNKNIFRSSMKKPDCVVNMALVVSMAVGFKLSPVLTDRLLQSAGLAFRLDNPEHIAYMFLLEYCQELDVEECNKILDGLGIKKTRQLGSHFRGKDGQYEGYRKRDE